MRPRDQCAFSTEQQVDFLRNFDGVYGILRSAAAFTANIVAVSQQRAGLQGSITEFGVFMGKFTVVLLLSAKKKELHQGVFIADAFEKLAEISGNPDGGTGCEKCMRAAVEKWAPGALDNAVFYIDDTRKIRDHHIPAIPLFRLISIDGDHSHEGTLIDLCVLAARILPGGIIIMDDFGNPDWPGVVTAWHAFVKSPTACDEYGATGVAQSVQVFAIIGNKIFLTTNQTWADTYTAAIMSSNAEFVSRYELKHQSKDLAKTIGAVADMFMPSHPKKQVLTDALALRGERKASPEGGEPPSYETHGAHFDPVLQQIHMTWLRQADNACPT